MTQVCPPAVHGGDSLAPERVRHPADRKLAIVHLVTVIVPLAGLVAAIVMCWGTAFNAWYLLMFAGMTAITAVGVTVGYHRLCTHKSFSTSPVLRYILASAGSMAVQGPVIHWCAEHRKHHQHSDGHHDPHSPHMSENGSWGEGITATLRGAYHAHVGWLFNRRTRGLGRYSTDLLADPALVLANRHFFIWVAIGLFGPALLSGLITMSWTGALLGFLWGGLVRVLYVHHVTWSVNSVCHLWGTQPFDAHDESRNNAVVAVLSLGEGWHNNHHAFPASARHGLRWWELDIAYIVIRCLASVGLVRDIKLPSPDRVKARLAQKH